MTRDEMNEKSTIKITADDLGSRKVDTRLKEQAAMARNRATARLHGSSLSKADDAPARGLSRWGLRLSYNSAVYMSLFGLLGGLVAWGMLTLVHRLEPTAGQPQMVNELLGAIRQINDEVASGKTAADDGQAVIAQIHRAGNRNPYYRVSADASLGEAEKEIRLRQISAEDARKRLIAKVLAFGVCGIVIAMFLAVAEPATARNLVGVVTHGSAGAAAGLAGGVTIAFFMDHIFLALGGSHDAGGLSAALTGNGRQVAARAVTWGVLGLFLSVGPGLVMRNTKKLAIGAAGGLMGGLLGGVLFDLVA